jgi:3-hydroxy-9,10-secoandrosta-1,3,5(10)-triene-9,17-dione monooxygenase
VSPLDVLDRVGAQVPVPRERARATEDARRVPTESVADPRETGFLDLPQPKRFGGMRATGSRPAKAATAGLER